MGCRVANRRDSIKKAFLRCDHCIFCMFCPLRTASSVIALQDSPERMKSRHAARYRPTALRLKCYCWADGGLLPRLPQHFLFWRMLDGGVELALLLCRTEVQEGCFHLVCREFEIPDPMKKHLNTLFVTLEGACLHKDGAAMGVRHEGHSRRTQRRRYFDGSRSKHRRCGHRSRWNRTLPRTERQAG